MAMSRWALLVISLPFLRHPVAAAQDPVPTPRAATGVGSIRGEVYDSLIGARLEGAHVRVHGTNLLATTNSRGRFMLDSVPAGTRVLLVDHPALDSAGLSDLPKGVLVVAGRTTQVRLAVPSLRTFAATACAGPPAPVGGDSGIVFGAVRDAESGLRLTGATVTMSWVAVQRAGGQPSVVARVRDVRTDSLGNYYVCGVASSVGVNARASAGPFASGELQLELGERRLLRHDLSVSREELEEDTLPGSTPGLATLVGSVRAKSGAPLVDARAGVLGVIGDAVTDSAGRFVLAGLPSGSQMLFVRRIGYGYSATAVELRNRDTTRVSLELEAITLLDTIRISASRWARAELDELERRLERASSSRVLTAEALRGLGTVSTAFYNFPSLHVQRRPGGVSVYMLRGARLCYPAVWLDGWPSSISELDAQRPEDLFALEVYPLFEVPLRYQQGYTGCGVVLVWTRHLR